MDGVVEQLDGDVVERRVDGVVERRVDGVGERRMTVLASGGGLCWRATRWRCC